MQTPAPAQTLYYTTGLYQGYVRVADRLVYDDWRPIGRIDYLHKRSNLYKALAYFRSSGLTEYCMAYNQHPTSTRYAYRIYRGR